MNRVKTLAVMMEKTMRSVLESGVSKEDAETVLRNMVNAKITDVTETMTSAMNIALSNCHIKELKN